MRTHDRGYGQQKAEGLEGEEVGGKKKGCRVGPRQEVERDLLICRLVTVGWG